MLSDTPEEVWGECGLTLAGVEGSPPHPALRPLARWLAAEPLPVSSCRFSEASQGGPPCLHVRRVFLVLCFAYFILP